MNNDERGSMRIRDVLRSLVAAGLVWVVITLLGTLAFENVLDAESTSAVVLLSWGTVVALPVLSAAVAALLLPVPQRHRLGWWLLAGVPVTLIAYVISTVRGLVQDDPAPFGQLVLVMAVLVLVAAGTAVVTGTLKARAADAAPAVRPHTYTPGGTR